jgi:hypothetical protein
MTSGARWGLLDCVVRLSVRPDDGAAGCPLGGDVENGRMSTSASERNTHDSVPTPLNVKRGQYIQEIGYDDDVDQELREALEAALEEELADEDVDDVFDAIIMWWRSDDPDLTDAIVDAQTTLADGGVLWLLTPKPNRDGHIRPSDISDAAPTAGMHVTSTVSAAPDWSGYRLVGKKSYG